MDLPDRPKRHLNAIGQPCIGSNYRQKNVDEGSAPKSNILHRDNTETRGPSIELLQVDDRLPSSSCQPCSGPRVLSNEQPLPVASSTIACVDEMSMMSPVLSNCTDAGAQSMQQPVARGLSPHSAAIDDLTPAPSGNPVLIRHSASTKTAPYPSPSLFISQRPESSGSPCQAVRNQYHPSQADSTLYYPAQLLNSTFLTSHQIAPFWQADLLRGHCPTTNTNDLSPVNAPCLTSVFPGYPAHRDICFKTQPRFPSTNRQGVGSESCERSSSTFASSSDAVNTSMAVQPSMMPNITSSLPQFQRTVSSPGQKANQTKAGPDNQQPVPCGYAETEGVRNFTLNNPHNVAFYGRGEMNSYETSNPNRDPLLVVSEGQPPGSTINIVNCQNIAVGEHAAAQSYAAKQMNDKSPPMFIEDQDLKQKSRQQAERDCKTVVSPACHEISLRPVRLQILRTPKTLDSEYDDSGHYCRRKDFTKMFEQPHGNITDQEMLDLAKQNAQKEAESKPFQSEEEKTDYIARHGNVVAVIGNPGIGKTTSMKKWVDQLVHGQMIAEVTFLFFVFIRNINFQKEASLLQFLLSGVLPQWKHSKDSDDWWLHKISTDRNVVIALDGLDEAAVDNLTAPAPVVNIYDRAKPLHFLLNLINGKLLPYARIIVTSRPNQLYHLHINHKPKFVVEILGLDEEAQNELGIQICCDKYKQVQETLQKNATVFAYCYVPVNFILTIHYLMENSSDTDFVSMTKVLSSACGKYSRGEQLRGENPKIAQLSKLAWNGFRQKQIVFGEVDFQQVDLDEITVQSFLSTSLVDNSDGIAQTILNGDKRIYFSHLIWQEFFVAVYLMLLASANEFKEVFEGLSDDRWEVVAQCLYGLCNARVMKLLSQSTNIRNKASQWKERKELLTNAAASYLKQCSQTEAKFEKIQFVCSWIHEANDQDLIDKLAPVFPCHISLSGTVLPSDVSNLFFILQYIPTPCTLDVDNCKFAGNAMKRFCLEASRLNTLKISTFYLDGKSFNNEDFESVLEVLPQISDELTLFTGNITPHMMKKLSQRFVETKHHIRLLELSSNKQIGDDGLKFLVKSLDQIKELRLCDCDLGVESARLISERLIETKHEIQLLNFSYNKKIGDEGLRFLTKSLDHINELELVECSLGAESVRLISERLAETKHKIQSLNLSFNEKIGDEGLRFLIQSLDQVQELGLNRCDLGAESVGLICGRLLETKHELKKLDLGSNSNIGDEGARSLIPCLKFVGDLDLSDCKISEAVKEEISAELRSLGLQEDKVSWKSYR